MYFSKNSSATICLLLLWRLASVLLFVERANQSLKAGKVVNEQLCYSAGGAGGLKGYFNNGKKIAPYVTIREKSLKAGKD